MRISDWSSDVCSSDLLAQPIPDQDPQIYEMASSCIDTRFPATSLNLVPRVYAIATRLLASGNCTNADVASKLNMHPRTLQRRLKEEGSSFEEIGRAHV